MIFCATRKAASTTAKLLGNWWAIKSPGERYWEAPRTRTVVTDPELRGLPHFYAGISCSCLQVLACLSSAIAFHHAGMDQGDRLAVENGFLNGDINVICCTSTLAVGVNLPCHFVIIKNTVTWSDKGVQEYSDLEIMQMLGRAGRPQFDNSAVAVIMTRQEKVNRYEKMVSGQEILESW
jgi:ATP-dependent DNA helicase HFM1/MER3